MILSLFAFQEIEREHPVIKILDERLINSKPEKYEDLDVYQIYFATIGLYRYSNHWKEWDKPIKNLLQKNRSFSNNKLYWETRPVYYANLRNNTVVTTALNIFSSNLYRRWQGVMK